MSSRLQSKIPVIALSISIVSLLMLGMVIWVNLSAQDKINELNNQIESMQSTLQFAEGMQPELTQIKQHIRKIEQKIRVLDPDAVSPPVEKTTQMAIQPHIITPDTPIQQVQQATSSSGSHWLVIVASFDTLKKAERAQKKQQQNGMNTRITTAKSHKHTWFRTVQTGFKSKSQAQHFAQQLKTQGIKDAWVQYKP